MAGAISLVGVFCYLPARRAERQRVASGPAGSTHSPGSTESAQPNESVQSTKPTESTESTEASPQDVPTLP